MAWPAARDEHGDRAGRLLCLPSYDFHDETSGYNGYSAGPGYDLVTGLGSPVANQLIPALDNAVAPVVGPLVYEAPEGQGPVSLQVVQVGSNIEILDANNNYAVVASAPVAVTSGIDILGAGNTTNTLTLDFGPFSPGDPFYQPNLSYPTGIPVSFDGGSLGGGSGTLVLEGGSFTNETDVATGPHSGTVTLDGTSITYTDLAPIIDTTTATTLTIDDPQPGDAVTVENDPNSPENGFATSQISGSGFEKIDLANKTNVVFDNTSSVTDTFGLVNPLVDNATFTIIQSTPQFHVTAPASASVTENASLVFSSANADAISVTDTSAGTKIEQLTLISTPGVLTLGSTSGLKFVSGSNGSSSITVQGTLANLNAALSGLKFTPTTGYAGAASVSTTYEDLGIVQTTTATTAVSVVVPASKPTVKIEAPKQGAVGKAVPLEILAADTNATAQAASYQFLISFGDGTAIKTVTSKSPLLLSHIYAHAGTYTVAVIAKDEYGHTSAVASVTIKILALLTVTSPLTSPTATASTGSASIDDAESASDDFAIAGNPQALPLTSWFNGTRCRPQWTCSTGDWRSLAEPTVSPTGPRADDSGRAGMPHGRVAPIPNRSRSRLLCRMMPIRGRRVLRASANGILRIGSDGSETRPLVGLPVGRLGRTCAHDIGRASGAARACSESCG